MEPGKGNDTQSRQTEKLATLGMLSSGIAHDFNNLLVSILGNADIALRNIPSDSPVYHYIESIKKASLKASGLTNQMLSYLGEGNLFVQPVDINALIDEMSQILKISIPKNITLKYSYTEKLYSVEADPTQIHQILMNLIINASEAIGDKDGVITVKTGICQSGDMVSVRISDTGPGMDKSTKERVFDPFFSTKPTGRGLGLSVAHENALAHRGTLEVESIPGKGAVFTLSLPMSDKPLRLEKLTSEYSDSLMIDDGAVLVIDDDTDVLEVIETMLNSIGINVHTFSNGRSATDFFQSAADSVDIVLLDITMPNMGGEEVYRSLRAVRPEIPVIFTSGYGQNDINQHFISFSESDFIRKPYQLETLIRKMNAKLNKS